MASTKLEKIRFSVDRRAKNTRRIDIYVFVLAAAFICTFIFTQVMLGVYNV